MRATFWAISRTAGDGSATATWKDAAGGGAPKAVAAPEPSAGLGSSIQAMLGRGAGRDAGAGCASVAGVVSLRVVGQAVDQVVGRPCGRVSTVQPAMDRAASEISAVSRARRRARRMALG
ncbi:hypothetical protein [Methylobacterium sp. WL1]|uniref:hypothetical protein n=1 Tax=Methylobacterium sp. WL1 TaxID=2603276 RepID=UPI0032B2D929